VQRVRVRLRARPAEYEILIGEGMLAALGQEARRRLPQTARRVALISNEKVFGLYGQEATRSLREAGLAPQTWLMGEGERFKSLRTLERAVEFLSKEATWQALPPLSTCAAFLSCKSRRRSFRR
jgi:3-dehydroquinate synthetase